MSLSKRLVLSVRVPGGMRPPDGVPAHASASASASTGGGRRGERDAECELGAGGREGGVQQLSYCRTLPAAPFSGSSTTIMRMREASGKGIEGCRARAGAITPLHAAGSALATGVSRPLILWAMVNPTTAVLGVSNIALYAGVYTWMKRKSIYNTWVGAIVGALPPLMGWAACGDNYCRRSTSSSL
ncbi:hypothetical protein C8R47DRAFT_1269988 [Mycena vitilis]|nr:hypothetical protein C8R47DRAFT_1269988 [Mycena vitilis]